MKHAPKLVLGLDPGRKGSGVLVYNQRAIAAMHWRTHTVNKRVHYALTYASSKKAQSTRGIRTPWELGLAIRKAVQVEVMTRGPLVVVAEAAHIGRNARTGLSLSRWGGSLVGPLESVCESFSASWVEPDQWRKGLFRTRWWKMQASEQNKQASMVSAKRIALAMLSSFDTLDHKPTEKEIKAKAKELFLPKREAAKLEAAMVIPKLYPGIDGLIADCGGAEHVYDAAGIATWMLRQ